MIKHCSSYRTCRKIVEDAKTAPDPQKYKAAHQSEYKLHDSLKQQLQELGITKLPSPERLQKKIDKQRGISINKLSTMSGIKQSTLDNIVRGQTHNPKAKTLHKIAIAFNMTLSEFLDYPELNSYCFEDDSDE